MDLILNVYLQYLVLGIFETTGAVMVTHIEIYVHLKKLCTVVDKLTV